MSLVTTEFAPITQPSPIFTFDNIVTLSPTHTFFPMIIEPELTTGLLYG